MKSTHLYFLLFIYSLIGCKKTSKQTYQTQKTDTMDTYVVKKEGYQYYRYFDKFTMQGIGPLTNNQLAYPFVEVPQNVSQDSIVVHLHLQKDFEETHIYHKNNGHYQRKNRLHQPDEELPFAHYYYFIVGKKQICYYYRSKDQDNSMMSVLHEVIASEGMKEITYSLPIHDPQNLNKFYQSNIQPSPRLEKKTLEKIAESVLQIDYSLKGKDHFILQKKYLKKMDEHEKDEKKVYKSDPEMFFYHDYIPNEVLFQIIG